MGHKGAGGRTLAFSFSVTLPGGTAREWAKSLPARDLALLAGALALFLLEPAALYWIFEGEQWRPPQAESKIALRSDIPPQAEAPAIPIGSNEEVITPLNVRDPSALIIGPYGH